MTIWLGDYMVAYHELSAAFPFFNPLRPNNDLSQTSPCNIKGLSVSEAMRIENMIIRVQFYSFSPPLL